MFLLRNSLQKIRRELIWPHWTGDWVLGRHACLGIDVLKLIGVSYPVLNYQKGRADIFTRRIDEGDVAIDADLIKKHLARKDVMHLVGQQKYFNKMPKIPPKFILMDSYSELVDQYFENKVSSSGFCCCYSDLIHDKRFKESFEVLGLLPLECIEDSYRKLFHNLERLYGEVPIIFLHFPTALETRDKYLIRAKSIFGAIERLANEFKMLHPIAVDENLVRMPINPILELKNFPYHFNDETYATFAKKVLDLPEGVIN